MAAIDQYIERIADENLRGEIQIELARLMKKKSFGLVFEHHMPDNLLTPEVPIRRGTNVVIRNGKVSDVYEVQSLTDTEATCVQLSTMNEVVLPLADLVAIAQRGDVIYPYLKPMDSVKNAPDSELWHTLIEADNYHALQLLVYLYAGQVDCIYIDPPYNKPDSHDWKYNCDYVDGTDSYRHSKWLSMMEARLKIAKKLLNPKDSVLIVTIDELEYHHLGCLLEQMFPEAIIQMVTVVHNPGGAIRVEALNRVNEYAYYVFIGSAKPSKSTRSFLPSASNDIESEKSKKSPIWRGLLRGGANPLRRDSPQKFYPILVDKEGKIVGAGDALPLGVDRNTYEVPEGLMACWPLKQNDVEGRWELKKATFIERWNQGFVRSGEMRKDGTRTIYYLRNAEIERLEKGEIISSGINELGYHDLDYSDLDRSTIPKTVWNNPKHNATEYGSNLLKNIIGKGRFSYPKSLYAVEDQLSFIVDKKPNALILDFFAGSGTTLHAVNLLNKEDGGHRRCIMVTNNEIGEPKEKELIPQGIKPGDEEWEKWGIARYVNWPRTKCSILGVDVNDKPIEGEYITSLTETKESDRKFTQINFFPAGAALKHKKSLVTLINKQKEVKLPTLTANVPFLVSEDDGYNASILFDVTKIDEYLEALEGNDHITNFFIVTDKDTTYRQVKEEISQLMGKIEEAVPVSMPMKDGFKANATFFKLGFLDKRSVARGRQLQELLPILWMKAGAKGECPTSVEGDYVIWPQNHIAILKKESCFLQFRQELDKYPEIEVVYIITDSQNAYLTMIDELREFKTYQLYRDYLENFRINYAAK